MQHKIKLLNKEENWHRLRNYKPNDTVNHNNKLWQNVTGLNSEPNDTSNDWVDINLGVSDNQIRIENLEEELTTEKNKITVLEADNTSNKTEISTTKTNVGDLNQLTTTAKSNLVGPINELNNIIGSLGGGLIPESITPSSSAPTVTNGYWAITQPGTYTNFGNVVLPENNFGFIFKNGNSFSIQSVDMPMQDLTPLENRINEKVSLKSINLFDKSKPLIEGVRINGTTGADFADAKSAITQKIEVKPNTNYFLKGRNNTNTGFRFIDKDGNFLKPLNPTTNAPIGTFVFTNDTFYKSPNNAEYAQFVVKNENIGDLTNIMFYEGNADVPYKEYKLEFDKSLIESNLKTQYLDEDDYISAGGLNLLNPKITVINNVRITSTGVDFSEVGSAMTGLIPIKGDTVYTIKGKNNTNNGARLMDENLNPLQFLTGTNQAGFVFPNNVPRRTPLNAKFLQFVFKNNGVGNLENVMLLEGSEDKPFEKFIPIINPNKIKGLNGATMQGGYTGTAKNLKDLIDINTTNINQNKTDVVFAKNTANESKTIAQLTLDYLSSKIGVDEKGSVGGVATLNENGKVPSNQIDLQGLTLKGNWNADTNSPNLTNGVGATNNYYIVSVAGSQDLGEGIVRYEQGDKIIYSEGKWILDKQKEIPKPISDLTILDVSNFIRVSDTLYNIYSDVSKEMISYTKVSVFPNNLPITDETIDNILYRKIGNEYFALTSFLANGEVNTKQYGIKSDGVTNDQPRFQKLINLLNYIGGGTIKLAKGRTRLLNEGLKWYSNINLIGFGYYQSILQCDATKTSNTNLNGIYNVDTPSNGSVWQPLFNCLWQDFMIDCSGYHNVGISNVGRKGMFILGMEYCNINRVFVYKSIGTGIGCDFLSRTAITNCIVMECGSYIGDGQASEIGQSGIGIGSNARTDESVVVDGNWCINNGNYQIFVESQGNDTNAKSNFAKIVNNHCYGGRYGIGNKGSGRTQIIGNTCYNNSRNGIEVIQRAYGNIITNNDISNSGKTGIYINANFVDIEPNIVANNNVSKCVQYGIYINQFSNYNSVINNTIYSCGLSGIILGHYCYNNTIRGNKIFNNGQTKNTENCFGVFSRAGYFNIIDSNEIFDNQLIKTQLNAIFQIKGKTIQASENGSGYEFLTIKPTIIKNNYLLGYNSGNAFKYESTAVENIDYVLESNLILE